MADHIIPHKDDAGQFWHGDLQSLCKHCHDSLKQRQEHGKLTQGCTEDGIPLDSGHHWS